jgi:hypothetical protein
VQDSQQLNGKAASELYLHGWLDGTAEELYGWMEHAFPSLGAGLAHSILLQSGRHFDISG